MIELKTKKAREFFKPSKEPQIEKLKAEYLIAKDNSSEDYAVVMKVCGEYDVILNQNFNLENATLIPITNDTLLKQVDVMIMDYIQTKTFEKEKTNEKLKYVYEKTIKEIFKK